MTQLRRTRKLHSLLPLAQVRLGTAERDALWIDARADRVWAIWPSGPGHRFCGVARGGSGAAPGSHAVWERRALQRCALYPAEDLSLLDVPPSAGRHASNARVCRPLLVGTTQRLAVNCARSCTVSADVWLSAYEGAPTLVVTGARFGTGAAFNRVFSHWLDLCVLLGDVQHVESAMTVDGSAASLIGTTGRRHGRTERPPAAMSVRQLLLTSLRRGREHQHRAPAIRTEQDLGSDRRVDHVNSSQEPPQVIRDLDEWCLRQMAYWGEQVARPESTSRAPGSVIQHLWEDLEAQQDNPLIELNAAPLAWRALASAGEHAGLAQRVHQMSRGGVVMRPQMSLARGAMLSSARAIYLLQPDDGTERDVRAAQLANQEVKDARDYLKVLATAHQGDQEPDALQAISRYFDTVKEAAEGVLAASGRSPDSRMGETALLKAVAPVLADGMEHPEYGVMSAWRKGSAVAHGRSWVWGALPDDAHPAQEFVTVWSVPLGLMGHAWTLWNLRRGSDSPPAYPPDDWDLDPALWEGPAQTPRPVELGSQASGGVQPLASRVADMVTVRFMWPDSLPAMGFAEAEYDGTELASGMVTPNDDDFPGLAGYYKLLDEEYSWTITYDNPMLVLLHESLSAHIEKWASPISDPSEEIQAVQEARDAVVRLVSSRLSNDPASFPGSSTVTSTEQTSRGLAVVGRCVVFRSAES